MVSARMSAAEAGEPGASGLLLEHGLVVVLVLGPACAVCRSAVMARCLQSSHRCGWVSRGVPHLAGSMTFTRHRHSQPPQRRTGVRSIPQGPRSEERDGPARIQRLARLCPSRSGGRVRFCAK
ncbi:hypothetical protein BSZ07_37710 [Streptomyces sp. M1013]|nr:hypothetical protein BSZ07_37710 [Streptomyces sp. M1013]